MLVFVQWRTLLEKVGAALKDLGLRVLSLRGGVADQQRTIDDFAGGDSAALLLAIEDDDSGLNLTSLFCIFSQSYII